MKVYGGIDLHSNNNTIALIDQRGKTLLEKKLPNDLREISATIKPYRRKLKGVVVESTFNWYWLVDALIERNIDVRLANTCAIKQYDGLKYRDDKTDARHLARLLRLGILPTGYIYPKEMRKVRDLFRKRLFLVRQRTAHILSFQSLVNRCLGISIKSNDIKSLSQYDLKKLFKEEDEIFVSGRANIRSIKFLTEEIKEIEKIIEEKISLRDEYKNLLSIPGVGKILAQTIMLETGDIARFKKVGNYVSYCRLVESKRMSNDKKKGEGNRKSGNKYLSWAYVEAATFAINNNLHIKNYYQRKEGKTNKIVAKKTIAHKLARASYYIIKDRQVFDEQRAFGPKKRGRQLS